MVAHLRPGDPERLGHYRVVGRLGRGGMGTVYLGEDEAGRRVAVKVINTELADDEAFHARFRREVTAARSVRRFCTAAVLDARLEGDPLYVVTEYVDGPTLDQAVREGGPLSGGALDGLAVGMATALGSIHAAGIVHRDLKPSNVMLSPTGPRVIDFGIARALDAADGPTRTGQFVGTPAYLAPELMAGGEVTPAADVFSWGCVVTYAGTGRAPFPGTSVPEVIHRVVNEPPVLDGLDPELHALVAAALDKDPRRRPTTPQLLAGLTGRARTEPAATARITFPPVGGTGPAAPPDAPATRPDAPSMAAPARSRRFWRDRRVLGLGVGAVGVIVAGAVVTALLLPDGDADGVKVRPPAAVETYVPSDDFSEPQSGWEKPERYRGGEYVMELRGSGRDATADSPRPNQFLPERARIDVGVRISGGAGAEAGVFCRSIGGAYGSYWLVLRADGTARIMKYTLATVRQLAGAKGGIHRDRVNRLQATCVHEGGVQRLAPWVNGRLVAQATDDSKPFKPVATGVVVRRPESDPPASYAFDDFAAYRV
ncbi:serine/threonine-protein kinase [Actinomadura alba]|uniref:Serine/threonine protein kinase n=1 Tax=Actinomadura alba TaxID=406431 RepID=A0ABR7LZI0_9ACTN|nr:serine/threonine-protein kinase [Actinomadura alba]MBC6469902.1 serine/threonine protein kinase [Actinomadura alba]